MTFGTLLTLFVVPCAYSIIGRKHASPTIEEIKPEIRRTKPIAKAAE
jgi:hypothetical protein